MPTSTSINLPLQLDQLINIVKALPKNERQQLIDVSQKDEIGDISEWQKLEVRKRVKKYNKYPELMVDEKQALKIIKQL